MRNCDIYQASRTFFVSGQAQQALHFGFSGVPDAGDGGVDTSGAFDSELPILLLCRDNKQSLMIIFLLNCISKLKITS